MHRRHLSVILLAAWSVTSGVSSAAHSTTITVSADCEADYCTIGEAMSAATAGDTVQVSAGTYQESVWLKDDVVLRGSGYEHTRIETDIVAAPVNAVGISGAEVEGLAIAYAGTSAVVTLYIHSSELAVRNCRVTNPVVSAVYAIEESRISVDGCLIDEGVVGVFLVGGSQAAIRASEFADIGWSAISFTDRSHGEVVGNRIRDSGGHGIEAIGAGPVRAAYNTVERSAYAGIYGGEGTQLDVRHNTVVANGSHGIQLLSGSTAEVLDNAIISNRWGGVNTEGGGAVAAMGHNDVWGNGITGQNGNFHNYMGLEPASTDVSINPFFLDQAGGDYRLRSNSPLIGAGSGGGTAGALGVAPLAEEQAHPESVTVLAYPEPAYWVLTQGSAYLSVDLHLLPGNQLPFVLDEVEVRYYDDGGNVVAHERIPTVDMRTTALRLETNARDLLMVWDATDVSLKPPPDLSVPAGGRGVFLPREPPLDASDLPVRVEYTVRGYQGGALVERVREVVPQVYRQQVDYRFPMRGGGWFVANGPPEDNHRHRGMLFRGFESGIIARYALDIFRVGREGIYHRTDASTNQDFWGYGAPIYAPAAGRIVGLNNEGYEPQPGDSPDPDAEIGYLTIDHGNDEYTNMYHIKPGSIVVEVGQWVEQGELVAELGASSLDEWGEPHLHLDLYDRLGWPAEGLPITFTDGRIVNAEIQDGVPITHSLFQGESLGPHLFVAADGSAGYTTIGDAMAVAVAGDTVHVGSGTYREPVWPKSSVALLGAGADQTRIETDTLASPVFARRVRNAVTEGFTLAYAGDHDVTTVYAQDAQLMISRCRITGATLWGLVATGESELLLQDCILEDNGGVGAYFTNSTHARVVDCQIRRNRWEGLFFDERAWGEVSGCVLTANDGNGITAIGTGPVHVSRTVCAGHTWAGVFGLEGAELVLRNNTLVGNGTHGVVLQSRSRADIVDNIIVRNGVSGIWTSDAEVSLFGHNDVWDNGVAYQGVTAPATDLSVDPLFVDPAAGDYHLSPESPLFRAGSTGGPIGALGTADDEGSTAIEQEDVGAQNPIEFLLGANYPNPFNASTVIPYQVARPDLVRLELYSLTGQHLHSLVYAPQKPGRYTVTWDGRDARGRGVASGVYLCELRTGTDRALRKLLLVR